MEAHWNAVGDIPVKGYREQRYFPIKLSKVFFKSVFDTVANEEEVLNNLFGYISEPETEILKKCLTNFSEVEEDDLLETLSNYVCKWKPTEGNIKQLIIGIAHQELIQKPAYITKCFRKSFTICNFINLENIYKNLAPTAKNIINSIKISGGDEANGPLAAEAKIS